VWPRCAGVSLIHAGSVVLGTSRTHGHFRGSLTRANAEQEIEQTEPVTGAYVA
jgi:hypothetical protein